MKRMHSRENSQEHDDPPLSVQSQLDNICENETSKKPKSEVCTNFLAKDQNSIKNKEIMASHETDIMQCIIDDKDVYESHCKDGK